MKKRVGYIFWGIEEGQDKKAFEKVAKKKGIEFIPFNISKGVDEKEIEEKAKRCDIIYNNSAEGFSIELVKTLEELGKKVVDSSEIYYYTEDKWIFFLKCKEHNIPTPRTILLSESIVLAKKELKNFRCWPVILKRIEGCGGDFVEKANNLTQAISLIKKFWKKGCERLPIIAQEFIKSSSYRVTVINGKIVQTIIKESTNWKNTGTSSERFRKFKVDKDLQKIVKKVTKVMKIKVCGIDLFKKKDKWLVLEVNSSPGLGFFDNAREKIIEEILNLLIELSNKKINKSHKHHK
ncbi:MAG: ATP-grasp domain-containing protein [archaeon]